MFGGGVCQNLGHVDRGVAVTLGLTPSQADLLRGTGFVADRVSEDSIWAVLARDGDRLFGDEMFADLFTTTGRRSVPPCVASEFVSQFAETFSQHVRVLDRA